MKILSLVLITLSALSLVHANELDTRRHITVVGSAKLLATPDIATWRINLRGESKSLAEASDSLDKAGTALVTALTEAGFTEDMVKLSAISSGRHYEGPYNKRIFKGFFTQRSATIELTDLSQRQKLETALLQDNRIEIVSFNTQSTKQEEFKQQVILDAAAAAKVKASQLAETLGAEIGSVLSISQGSNNQFGGQAIQSNRISISEQGLGSAEVQKLTYSASVTVKFELK
ncbi:MAG: SIMPL domain-containing protein [Akkermansiaceae bacterium]